MKRIEIIGQKFSHWTVLEYVRNHHNHSLYLCRCDCGTEKEVSGAYLRRGSSRSCGCLERPKRPFQRELSNVHRGMMLRCYESDKSAYKDYGARGVSVCREWHHPKAFSEWCLSNGYTPGLQIDRIDSNGNYEPSNCRFVTRKQNMNNTRRTRRYTFRGIHGTVSEIADKLGLRYEQVRSKIRSEQRRTA